MTRERPLLSHPFPLPLLYPAVFLSGATALVYEIVWARQLALILGSTTGAVAAVLSAFMLGLALGAVLVGRRSDRSRRPLRWYGLLEVGIGVYALAFRSIVDLVGDLGIGSPWLVAFVLLLVPAALMGGTLPVLARAAADTTERGTRALGSLYGVNTLGAMAGALLATLVLLEGLGLAGTTIMAACVNVALGLLFWGLAWAAGDRPQFAGEEDGRGRSWRGDAEVGIVAAFFLAGFAGLALQTAWVRLLVYYLEGFTIAFGLMLAAYLLGLGGGALAGTALALRSFNPRRLLARILLLEGLLALATLLFAGPLGDHLEAMRAGYTAAERMDAAYASGLFLMAAAIVLPATFLGGMLMPAVARIALSDRESIGKQTGVVYAASTLGAVIAPPLTGFLLVPALGVPGTIGTVGGLLLLAGTAVALTRGLREWIVAGGAAVVFVLLCLTADLATPLVTRSHVFRSARTPRRLRAFEEGQLAGVSVVEELDDGSRRLYLDGFSAAETSPHYGYMRLLGHLPVLLHPKPERALVIAFGTGTTAGAVAVHPELEHIVCVEIEPAVYNVAGEFAAQNRGVLEDPRTVRVVADGREYVQRDGEPFDVITLEPLMPYTPAAVYLYTREFYEAARRRLSRDGLLCQWIPPQGVSAADLRRLVASVQSVFPFTSLWYFEHAVVVVGAEAAPRIDGAAFLERCARPEVLRDLEMARVGTPAHLLGAHVVSGAALERALAGVDPMVDDRTDLEFRPLPRRFGRRSQTFHAENLEFLAGAHDASAAWVAEPLGEPARRAVRSFGAALSTLALEMRRRVEGGEVVPAVVLDPILAQDPGALFALSIQHRRRYEELLSASRFGEAAELRYAPDRSRALVALAQRASGEQRLYYLILAVRENALLNGDERLLEELAASLDGPAGLLVANRLRALRGEPLRDGEEALPEVPLPDLRAALESGSVEQAKDALARARAAGRGDEAERAAWEWWRAAADDRQAFRVLGEIGSSNVQRAALRLAARGGVEDLVAVAPFFALAYPAISVWEDLCGHASSTVREAAADAARVSGGAAHLPVLLRLCRDESERVRLSAFIAFGGIRPGAMDVGYDPSAPTEEALAALARLAGE